MQPLLPASMQLLPFSVAVVPCSPF
uniref:Uncharacterized protein n=1 Tax=Arundo donax TaxID=35708 RepID=A0A0A9EGZ8_ARUDO